MKEMFILKYFEEKHQKKQKYNIHGKLLLL